MTSAEAKKAKPPRKDKATAADLRAVLGTLLPMPLSDGQWERLQRHYPVDGEAFGQGLELIRHWRAGYDVKTHLGRVLYRQPSGELAFLAHHAKLQKPSHSSVPVSMGDCRWLLGDKQLAVNSPVAKGDMGPVLSTKVTHKLKPEELEELVHMNAERLRLLGLFLGTLPVVEGEAADFQQLPPPPLPVAKPSKKKKDKKEKKDKKSSKKDKRDKEKKRRKAIAAVAAAAAEKKPDGGGNKKKRKLVEVDQAPVAPNEFDYFARAAPLQPLIAETPVVVKKPSNPPKPAQPTMTTATTLDKTFDTVQKYNSLLPWFQGLARISLPVH